MGYIISRRYKSRRTDDATTTTLYEEYDLISDSSMDQSSVDAAFFAYIPTRNNSLSLSRYESSVEEDSLDRKWVATAEWSGSSGEETEDYPEQDPGVLMEQFSTDGSTVHINQGYSETVYAVGSDTPPSFDGGIGWSDGSFQGTDVIRPAFSFSLDKEYDYDDITAATKTFWANMTGVVNSDLFQGYSAGTVLFMGASGGTSVSYDGTLIEVNGVVYKKASVKYNVTFKFRCQPNLPVDICGLTINKNAWDYIWVLRTKEDREGRTVEIPVGVYVNQVYVYDSFEGLIP